MSKTLKTDQNVHNHVYSGKFTGEESASNPLSELMKPEGDQFKVTYEYGLRWVEGTKKWGVDVNKADDVRLDPAAMRYKTHGKNPGNDDQDV